MLIPSLWIPPPSLYGCADLLFGCLLWPREGADWRLPGTAAVPLGAHAPSFGFQHVYLLPPLLLFPGRTSICGCVCLNVHV